MTVDIFNSDAWLNQIILGDCITSLKKIPDASSDLIVSSPPYNIGKAYEAKRGLQIYLDEQTHVLRECARILKATGSIFWQVGSFSHNGSLIPLDIRFFPILEGLGLIPRNRIAWIRPHGLHATRKFSGRYETILWFTKSDQYKFNIDPIRVPQKWQNKKHHQGDKKGKLSCNPNGKNPGDVWAFQNVKHNHEEQTIHPCQFPEDLIARIILATTNINDIVVDPYMGTGTVAVVARNHGRSFFGTELDNVYYSVAMRRLHGLPDENNCFPNLKTLRDYVNRTGLPIHQFSFDVQIGKTPSSREQSKRNPEHCHLQDFADRLEFEEDSFAADLRGEKHPVYEKLNGGKSRARDENLSFFEDLD
ncbi:MAG: site-specific DNA-methyltransferase [Chloroflexota bacterium]